MGKKKTAEVREIKVRYIRELYNSNKIMGKGSQRINKQTFPKKSRPRGKCKGSTTFEVDGIKKEYPHLIVF